MRSVRRIALPGTIVKELKGDGSRGLASAFVRLAIFEQLPGLGKKEFMLAKLYQASMKNDVALTIDLGDFQDELSEKVEELQGQRLNIGVNNVGLARLCILEQWRKQNGHSKTGK